MTRKNLQAFLIKSLRKVVPLNRQVIRTLRSEARPMVH